MDPDLKIFVAGHRGMVGSAIVRRLKAAGFTNLLLRPHRELDLTDQAATHLFLQKERPAYIILAAAHVGGIYANNTYPAEFIYQNLMIEANVVHEAWRAGVEQLLFLGSSCIYPKFAAQPMKEEALLTGVLEPTNEPYAVAKIAGIKMCTAYNRQYGTNYVSVMPTNVYGPGDNYNLETSHVVAALIRKAHEAKVGGERTLNVWGTGRPRREFIYSDDLADACLFLMEHASAADVGELVNVGTGVDLSIEELARQVAEVVGFKGDLVFDTTKPDGVARKLLDVSKLTALGWRAKTVLDEGLRLAYEDFLAHHAQ